MPKSVDLQQKNKTRWTLVRGFVKAYGGFRKQSKLFTDHEQYLLGITNQQLYGHDIEVSESLEATLSVNDAFEPFQSYFEPEEMRCLALIAHNHMKPAMKAFVEHRKELLKKFRLTGTKTTMTMLKTVFGEDNNVVYGPSFKSGPLGGDAEACALMCQEDLGGVLFFMDPLDSHPHLCDIETLIRLSNVQNVLLATNPTSAHALCYILELALRGGRKDMIPSFFKTLESPGVKVYNKQQKNKVEELNHGNDEKNC